MRNALRYFLVQMSHPPRDPTRAMPAISTTHCTRHFLTGTVSGDRQHALCDRLRRWPDEGQS